MIVRNTPAHIRLHISASPAQPRAADLAQLSADEQKTCARLATTFLQARYCAAHALLRSLLEAETGIPARQLRLRRGPNNRPELDDGDAEMHLLTDQAIDFNLSYSGSLIACAVARGVRVGVDVERVAPDLDFARLAARVMTAEERAQMDSMDERDTRQHFFQTWALKEAWAKARGEGLGLPFANVSLLPAPQGLVRADLYAAEDDHRNWSFLRAWLTAAGNDGAPGRTELAVACQAGAPIKAMCSFEQGIKPGFYADGASLAPALPLVC